MMHIRAKKMSSLLYIYMYSQHPGPSVMYSRNMYCKKSKVFRGLFYTARAMLYCRYYERYSSSTFNICRHLSITNTYLKRLNHEVEFKSILAKNGSF
jgi:hypothetical protein